MRNEYGVKLDSNGYVPSIVRAYETDACFICDSMGDLVRHEIYGASNRQKSKAYGLWVNLCPQCHAKVHEQPEKYAWLKVIGQRYAMNWYDWSVEDFRKRFGRSYAEK